MPSSSLVEVEVVVEVGVGVEVEVGVEVRVEVEVGVEGLRLVLRLGLSYFFGWVGGWSGWISRR